MLLSPSSSEKVSKIRVKNREPVPSYRMDRNDDEIGAMMSDGEGQSSDNLEREDSSEEGDLDDAGSQGGEQIKRQDSGDMEQELQVHQALLRQAEAAAHMQTLMQSQLGLPGFAGFGLPSELQAQLQAHIQALSSGQVANGAESQSPPVGMGPPKTSSPVNGSGSQTSLLAMAGRNTPTFGKQRHLSNSTSSPRRARETGAGAREDEQDSTDGSASPSPPASMLASIAAAASALRSPNGGLLPPASTAAHPYLASAFSSALGNLSALTSGLSGSGASGHQAQHQQAQHGQTQQQQQQPPLTPSPSSDSPQHNTEVPRAVNSSQQSWTFEEQFKQLYELNDDPGRKAFLDDLFDFMQKRGTPITRLPIMAKQVLDLYELYNLVVARGGLVDVINKKLWQEIIKGLHLPSSITSAAFTLRTQYMKYLYPYECEKEKYSSPSELQAAIDGNRREGRRSSYGAYADLVPRSASNSNPASANGSGSQHAASLSALASHMSHMSPLSLVSRPAALNGNGHHRAGSDSPPSQSPHEALAELNMSRIHLWNIYNSLGGDVGGDMAAAMAAASRFLPQTAATAGTGASGSQPPQTEALNLAAEQHAAAQAAAAAAARVLELNKENNKDKDRDAKGRRSDKRDEEREKRDRSYDHEERSQSSIRIKEESLLQDGAPASKRLMLDDDVSLNMRMTPIGLPGANIKITSRGDGRANDSSLVVSMEINGIVYQGVLFAQAAAAAAAAAALTPARGRMA